MAKSSALDQLQEIHELNRAFLGLLQARARCHRPGLGLPATAEAALAAAGTTLLDGVAAFPRALFHIDLTVRACSPDPGEGGDVDEAEHALGFSILFAARQTSRQSAFRARLLFGLDCADVERFRASSLGELQRLACMPGVLQCAFRDSRWFWQALFTATRPELRRQLTLMALQPRLVPEWPQRRPPQPTA